MALSKDESLPPHETYARALELPPGERTAFLIGACVGDHELEQSVLRMLARRVAEAPDLPIPQPDGYVVEGIAGRGGMGIVYRARELRCGSRLVALKFLPPHLENDRAAIRRLTREAELLGSLSHPRIEALLSVQGSDDRHFLVMEFVEGSTLARILADGPLPLPRALAIGRDVANALAFAHSRDIIHRDLKPANVMVTPDGGAKILDFGIAKLLADPGVARSRGDSVEGRATGNAGVSAARGTPGYMSPEQVRLGIVSKASDLFSFGCVLYELIAGTGSPGRGHHPPPPLPSGTPRPVRQLIARCLEPDPADRLQDANAAARILDGALEARSRRRRRARLVAGAVLLPAAAACIPFLLSRPGPTVRLERVDDHTLHALDGRNRVRWTRHFDDRLSINTLRNKPAPDILVLAPDGRARAVVATDTGIAGASLWCLDAGSSDVLWTRELSWIPPLGDRGRLDVRWTAVVPWPDPAHPAIAVQVAAGDSYPSAMQFVSLANEVIATYSHPGWLYFGGTVVAPDGRTMLLLYGDNSSARFAPGIVPFETDSHCGAVVLLTLSDPGGQAYPWSEDLPVPRDWPGVERAAEAAYLLIPPCHPDLSARVEGIAIEGSGARLRIAARLNDRRRYVLGARLEPLSSSIMDSDLPTPITSVRPEDYPALRRFQNGALAEMYLSGDTGRLSASPP